MKLIETTSKKKHIKNASCSYDRQYNQRNKVSNLVKFYWSLYNKFPANTITVQQWEESVADELEYGETGNGIQEMMKNAFWSLCEYHGITA